jgi:hypothetical protein
MTRPASLPGRLLEPCGDARPRGMAAHDRTRLIGRLLFFYFIFFTHGVSNSLAFLPLPLAGEGWGEGNLESSQQQRCRARHTRNIGWASAHHFREAGLKATLYPAIAKRVCTLRSVARLLSVCAIN